jgi:hypothetical protein
MTNLLERIAKALEGVTPGPWKYENNFGHLEIVGPPPKDTYFNAVAGHYGIDQSDAAFIVAARSLLPEAAKELEAAYHATSGVHALRTEIANLRAELKIAREGLETIECGPTHLHDERIVARATLAQLDACATPPAEGEETP